MPPESARTGRAATSATSRSNRAATSVMREAGRRPRISATARTTSPHGAPRAAAAICGNVR